MLILTRKRGESIIIDGRIEIKVTDISDEKIKLGIEAPPDMKVYRKELYETLQENRSAASVAAAGILRDLSHKIK